MDKFCGGALTKAHGRSKEKEVYNFVEVTHLPKKFDCVSSVLYSITIVHVTSTNFLIFPPKLREL